MDIQTVAQNARAAATPSTAGSQRRRLLDFGSQWSLVNVAIAVMNAAAASRMRAVIRQTRAFGTPYLFSD
jgi:hypothetical protein